MIQVGIDDVLYEVSEGPGKELTVCVSIELGTVNSDTTTVVLLTPPSPDNTGKSMQESYKTIAFIACISISIH